VKNKATTKKLHFMKTVIFSILVVLFSISSYAQGNDLSKMDSLQRNEYLTKLAKEVLKNFAPDFYSEKLKINISPDPEVFYNEWGDQPKVKKHFNRKYYIVKLENLELKREFKICIWESDGEPVMITYLWTGWGCNFFYRSYKDWIRDGVKEEEKFHYEPKEIKEKPNLAPDSFYIPAETTW
jgi:hypothetical protein